MDRECVATQRKMYAPAVALALMAGAVAQGAREFTTIQASETYDPRAATALQTVYPKQHHYRKGRYSDHFWIISLGSASFDDVDSNSYFSQLKQEGQLLTNYYAVSNPAQANLLAMVGGDTFGLTDERFVSIPSNVSTIAESFEEARVLWAQYSDGQPFTGYPGWSYENPYTGTTYSRSRNPFITFDSVADEPKRLVNLKSLQNFYQDKESGHIAQVLFIQPPDEAVADLDSAGAWLSDVLGDLPTDKKLYHRKNVIVTFANSTDSSDNRVWTLLLGDIEKRWKGSEDDTYYDHYSIPATLEGNYEIPTLGRYDCGANLFNVFNFKIHHHNTISGPSQDGNSYSLGGFLSSTNNPLPIPNINCEGSGRAGTLGRVKKIWKKMSYSYYQWTFDY